jgi:hypothetical protein
MATRESLNQLEKYRNGNNRASFNLLGQECWSPVRWITVYTSPRDLSGVDFCHGFCHDLCHTFWIGPGPLGPIKKLFIWGFTLRLPFNYLEYQTPSHCF